VSAIPHNNHRPGILEAWPAFPGNDHPPDVKNITERNNAVMFFCPSRLHALNGSLANDPFFMVYCTKSYPAYIPAIITQPSNADLSKAQGWYQFAEHRRMLSCSFPALINMSISIVGDSQIWNHGVDTYTLMQKMEDGSDPH
jgi:hypothetical protein